MKNWKTTIGGAFSATGVMLMGGGMVPQLQGSSSKFLTAVTIAGFICTAIGTFLAHLFAADAQTVKNLADVVTEHGNLIASNTAQLKKSDVQAGQA